MSRDLFGHFGKCRLIEETISETLWVWKLFVETDSDIVVGNVAVNDLAMLGAEASASHTYGPKPYI